MAVVSIMIGHISFFIYHIPTFVHDFVHNVAVWEVANKVCHFYLILSTTQT